MKIKPKFKLKLFKAIPKSISPYCGDHGLNLTWIHSGGYQCECHSGFSALPSSKCQESLSTTPRCILREIPHGNFVNRTDFMLVNQSASVKCDEGYRQTVHAVHCDASTRLSIKLQNVCIDNECDILVGNI